MKWKDRGFYKRYLYTIRLNNLIKRRHVTGIWERIEIDQNAIIKWNILGAKNSRNGSLGRQDIEDEKFRMLGIYEIKIGAKQEFNVESLLSQECSKLKIGGIENKLQVFESTKIWGFKIVNTEIWKSENLNIKMLEALKNPMIWEF